MKTKANVKTITFVLCLLSAALSMWRTWHEYIEPSSASIEPGQGVVQSVLPSAAELPTDELSLYPEEFDCSLVPEFSGDPYVTINDNIPYFSESDKTTHLFAYYSKLDELGRCGVAYANVCKDLMPTTERGSIGQIKPTGWHTVKYDCVSGGYLYNRCHLIGYQLTGENANERNLITGTRWLNTEGMLDYENMVAEFVEYTNYHVLYRVTPIFVEDELVCRGVLMEGWSVEDEGDGICYCVFVYNAQPGVTINYGTGESTEDASATWD